MFFVFLVFLVGFVVLVVIRFPIREKIMTAAGGSPAATVGPLHSKYALR